MKIMPASAPPMLLAGAAYADCAGANVTLVPSGGQGASHSLITGSDGRAGFTGLPWGACNVSVSFKGLSFAYRREAALGYDYTEVEVPATELLLGAYLNKTGTGLYRVADAAFSLFHKEAGLAMLSGALGRDGLVHAVLPRGNYT